MVEAAGIEPACMTNKISYLAGYLVPQRCLMDFRLWDEYERQALRRARWSRLVTYDLPGRSNLD